MPAVVFMLKVVTRITREPRRELTIRVNMSASQGAEEELSEFILFPILTIRDVGKIKSIFISLIQ